MHLPVGHLRQKVWEVMNSWVRCAAVDQGRISAGHCTETLPRSSVENQLCRTKQGGIAVPKGKIDRHSILAQSFEGVHMDIAERKVSSCFKRSLLPSWFARSLEQPLCMGIGPRFNPQTRTNFLAPWKLFIFWNLYGCPFSSVLQLAICQFSVLFLKTLNTPVNCTGYEAEQWGDTVCSIA